MSRATLSSAVVALILALASSTALAADPKGKPKTIKLDEISVEGKIQKPQAFYILPRSNLNYTGLDTQESLLPRIKKAVRSEPF
jgi:hypothetical protein